MNIHDVEPPSAIPISWAAKLENIFQRQRELMDEYKKIEGLPDPPVSLHHAHGQRILKDFAWRCAEELTESAEALRKHRVGGELDHQREEMADALHFLVELCIFAGLSAAQCAMVSEIDPKKLAYGEQEEMLAYWEAIYELGVAMNFLRNKSWKMSQVPTDEARFRMQLLTAFQRHVDLWSAFGLTDDDLYVYYFRKSEVNKFRQRSNY